MSLHDAVFQLITTDLIPREMNRHTTKYEAAYTYECKELDIKIRFYEDHCERGKYVILKETNEAGSRIAGLIVSSFHRAIANRGDKSLDEATKSFQLFISH